MPLSVSFMYFVGVTLYLIDVITVQLNISREVSQTLAPARVSNGLLCIREDMYELVLFRYAYNLTTRFTLTP